MDNIVIEFLNGKVLQPVLEDYIDAYTLMTRLNALGALNECTAILQGECYSGDQRLIDAVHEVTIKGLDLILTEYGIFFLPYNLDTSLHKRCEMVEAVIAIEEHGDSELILNCCANNTDPLMTLLEMITMVSRFDLYYFADSLLKVNHTLIERIQDYHMRTQVSLEEEVRVFDQATVKALKAFVSKFPQSKIALDLKENKLSPSTDINTLLRLYKAECIACDSVSVTAGSQLVLGMTLLSDHPVIEYQQTAGLIANAAFVDATFISSVLAKLTEDALGVV